MAQAQTSLRKFTTLEELEKSNIGPVWVLNTTQKLGEAANLLMSIPKTNGTGIDLLRIPKSFVPFDLTEQVNRSQLLTSSEFRNTVRKSLVKLLSREYAEALLATPEGKAEKKRLDNKMQQAMMAVQNEGVVSEEEDDEDEFFDPNNVLGENKKSRQAVTEEVKRKETAKASVDADMKVQNMVARSESENWTQIQIVGAIRNLGKVSSADLKYMAKAFGDKPKVKAHLEGLKEKLKAKKAAARK